MVNVNVNGEKSSRKNAMTRKEREKGRKKQLKGKKGKAGFPIDKKTDYFLYL